ncbi:hypothetical protein [Roseomonas sp. AR75]|uniref:hypothetical protein n=1 Tax=Roseomonas sp. AR75 TaxID=2562311 RepID=UPI0010C0F6E8|nr:hypothetical protein [Roseomonas sp. AR75]
MSVIIEAPPISTLRGTAEFIEELYENSNHEHITIDAARWRFTRPFNMLLLGHRVTYFRHLYRDVKLDFVNFPAASAGYFRHFRLMDYLEGRRQELRETRQNDNYIAITRVPVRQLLRKARNNSEEIGIAISTYAGTLVDLLFRNNEAKIDVHQLLRFSLREMIRNVFEHSNARAFYICGQYWPSQKRIQVALSDTGVGIECSLRRNSSLQINCARDAIHFALLPGVSGSPDRLHRQNKNDMWRNSGFGLFLASRFCRKSGGFSISSGDCCLVLDEEKTSYDIPHAPGVVIRLDLLERDLVDANGTLRRLVSEGEALQQKLTHLPLLTASSASKMLSVSGTAVGPTTAPRKKLSFTQDDKDEIF